MLPEAEYLICKQVRIQKPPCKYDFPKSCFHTNNKYIHIIIVGGIKTLLFSRVNALWFTHSLHDLYWSEDSACAAHCQANI